MPSGTAYRAPGTTGQSEDRKSLIMRPNYKNGMEDHEQFVDSMMKQGAKFRRTLKYGFPLEARKTIKK